MSFDEYMEWCLYDPSEGFFSSCPVRSGRKGDFVTSPEISWAFGVPVGEWAEKSAPSPQAALIEFGPGTGSLLAQIADIWTMDRDLVFAIERSSGARRHLAQHFEGVIVAERIDEIPAGIDAVIIVNEVLDNMPAEDCYYFVHSYRAPAAAQEHAVGVTNYGGEFAAAVATDQLFAVQFHPEKSQGAGRTLLDAFAKWVRS